MDKHELYKQLAMSWSRTGKELEARRCQELAAVDHLQSAPLVNDLVALGMLHQRDKAVSGLVEQQRLFAHIRAKLATSIKP